MEAIPFDELLMTTRSVRKRLDFDRPVPSQLVLDCVTVSQQAPTGSDQQGWRWVMVTEPAIKEQLGDLYRRAAAQVLGARPDPASLSEKAAKILASSDFLADNLHRAPVLAVPCIKGRIDSSDNFAAASLYGSIFPAIWSFMLAARGRGLGTSLTTSSLLFEAEVAELLGIPSDVSQIGIIPVAFYTGATFRSVERPPAEWITSWNRWGSKAPS